MISATGSRNQLRAARSRPRAVAGFTLLELMIVILIIGVLVGVSMPLLSVSARKFSFSQSISRVQAFLRYIQRHAIAEQRTYRVLFESQGGGQRVEWLEQDAGQERWVVFSSSLVPETLGIATLMWRNENSVAIVFYPNGTANSVELAVEDAQGNKALIQTSVSGEIIVEKKHEEHAS